MGYIAGIGGANVDIHGRCDRKLVMHDSNPGMLHTTLGGVCWGFSGTCGQYLFAPFEVDTLWLTCVRLLGGGGLLTALALVRERDSLKGILCSRRDCLQLLLYGVLGLVLCQYAYMTGIFYSNAATTTVLQNLGLVLIMLWTCLRSLRLPNRREFAALLLALFGVFMLATGGNPSQMTLSPQGLFWGLAAAVAVMLYTLLPRPLLARWGRIAVTAEPRCAGMAVLRLPALERLAGHRRHHSAGLRHGFHPADAGYHRYRPGEVLHAGLHGAGLRHHSGSSLAGNQLRPHRLYRLCRHSGHHLPAG